MEVKKIRKSKRDVVGDSESPVRKEFVNPNSFGSPDFPPGSQDCVKVGWDWSEESNQKRAKIRFVEAAPKTKSHATHERLQCLRPRRLMPSVDSAVCDTSSFINDLKSLASSLNRSSTSTDTIVESNVLANDLSQTKGLVNPKEMNSDVNNIVSSGISNKTNTSPQPDANTEFFNELLEDSMCEEIVKCTQDLESKLCNSKTPVMSEKRSSSSKKKLSLSLKKKVANGKTVCRKLESNINEANPSNKDMHIKGGGEPLNKIPVKVGDPVGTTPLTKNMVPVLIKEVKELRSSSLAQLDECDDLMIHCLADTGKKNFPLKKSCKEQLLVSNTDRRVKENHETGETATDKGVSEIAEESSALLDSDDFLVSPDILGLIDQCERKATQELSVSQTCSKPTKVDGTRKHDTGKRPVEQPGTCNNDAYGKTTNLLGNSKNHNVAMKVTEDPGSSNNSVYGQKRHALGRDANTCAKYTPQEIERKRQEAIRKRLSLKKKSC